MKSAIRYWLEVLGAGLVLAGIWLLVDKRDTVEALDLILGVGILGTMLLTAGSLALSRRETEARLRPYIGTVAAEIQSWNAAEGSGWAAFRIQNSGPVPGRITSHLTKAGDRNPMPPEKTKGDMLFPGDSINVGWKAVLGETIAKTISYRTIDGRRSYTYRVEYLVERNDSGQIILSIIDRSGS